MSTEPHRVAVFIDERNLYNDARRAFHKDKDPASSGHVDPWAFGELIASRIAKGSPPRQLEKVWVYRGLPGPNQQPMAHAATQRQAAFWRARGCNVQLRPLRYPADWPRTAAQEKGIDVQLGTDVMVCAAWGFYDYIVIASTDTDLHPVLEGVEILRTMGHEHDLPSKRVRAVEVSSWYPTNPIPRKRLRHPLKNLWCHWLDEAAYESIRDRTNYTLDPNQP